MADILAAIWFILIILALFLIPRSTRIRVAERFGLGILPRFWNQAKNIARTVGNYIPVVCGGGGLH